MKVTIEKIIAIKKGILDTYEIAFVKSGHAPVTPKEFKVGELVLFFESGSIKHIEEFEILKDRFMQEGDDVTNFLT